MKFLPNFGKIWNKSCQRDVISKTSIQVDLQLVNVYAVVTNEQFILECKAFDLTFEHLFVFFFFSPLVPQNIQFQAILK